MKRNLLFIFIFPLILLSGCFVDIPELRPDGPTIIVYGKVTNNITGMSVSEAVISDGFSTTLTDKYGEFRFRTFPGATHVFISVPEQYEIPMNDGMPQIFEPIYTSKDSINVNFSLRPLKNGIEKEFTLIAVADPQVQNLKHFMKLNNETITDIKKEIEHLNNVYGLTLGDIVYDSLSLFDDVKESFISSTIPFFHTIGNHDFSSTIFDPMDAAKEYMSTFGPLNYSFNRGDAHIIVMNNVFNYGVTPYKWGFSKEQIAWLKSDLSNVPKSKLLIICVHVPVMTTTSIVRKSDFIDAISSFEEIHIFSGHLHVNRNYINTDLNIYEHITGAACGMWWNSTVNICGAPNGYGVYEISGNKMKNWYYKSVKYDKEHQINMFAPYTFGDKDGYVVANIWNADENWVIEMFEDDVNRGKMELFTDYPPEVFTLNKSLNISETNTNRYQKTNHLYRLKPIDYDASIIIKVTDQFGNIYQQNIPLEGLESLSSY